jgi:hypothetical protein
MSSAGTPVAAPRGGAGGGGWRRGAARRSWRAATAGLRRLGWREAVGCAVVVALTASIVAVAHANASATDAAVLQATLNGWGAGAAARTAMLVSPLPSFVRTLARALQYTPAAAATDSVWGDLAAPLVAALPFVSTFALIDDVAGPDRAAWEANATAAYGRPIAMRQFAGGGGTVMPPAERYFVVAAVVGTGALTPGVDLFSDPPRRRRSWTRSRRATWQSRTR